MVNNSDKLYKAYLGELKEQVYIQIIWQYHDKLYNNLHYKITSVVIVFPQMTSSTKEPKLLVVAGCLRGIAALMINFTKTMEEGRTLCSIYVHKNS